VTAVDVSVCYIDTALSGSAVNRRRDGRLEKTTVGSAAVFSPRSKLADERVVGPP